MAKFGIKPARWDLTPAQTEAPGLWHGCVFMAPIWDTGTPYDLVTSRYLTKFRTATPPSVTPISDGYGLEFAGVSNVAWALKNHSLPSGGSALTMMALVTKGANWQIPFSYGQGYTGNDFSFGFDGNGIRVGFNPPYNSRYTTTATDGEKYNMIAASPQGAQFKDVNVWLNGTELTESYGSTSPVDIFQSLPLAIGGGVWATSSLAREITGDVSISAIWDRVLSDSEISLLSSDPFAMLRRAPSRIYYSSVSTVNFSSVFASSSVFLASSARRRGVASTTLATSVLSSSVSRRRGVASSIDATSIWSAASSRRRNVAATAEGVSAGSATAARTRSLTSALPAISALTASTARLRSVSALLAGVSVVSLIRASSTPPSQAVACVWTDRTTTATWRQQAMSAIVRRL